MAEKMTIPERTSRGTVSVPERLRFLNETEHHAVLATESGGQPLTSLVAYALTDDLKGALFVTPKKTRKYTNILANGRVALLIDTRTNTDRAYLEAEAVTMIGMARSVRKGKRRDMLIATFLRKHPRLAEFANSPSTAIILIEARRYIHVGRFQSVSEWIIDN